MLIDHIIEAGLFSAVLTAFVIETYTLLQPDSSNITNQLLIYGFSGQLSRMQLTDLNLTSLITSPTPSTPARWINALFFISLVLSLAAALFGILAKQWLREYMQWNAPLGSSRENILIRQYRFEAWETWNVAATITSIPALLELAMILFLTGILILLWTLDDIVAVTLTVIVAALLVVVSAFTVLPVLFTRCPYKSPTAWAFMTGCHMIAFPIVYLAGFFKVCGNHLRSEYLWRTEKTHPHSSRLLAVLRGALKRGPWPERGSYKWKAFNTNWPWSRNWRERDYLDCRIARLGPWWNRQDTLKYARLELDALKREEFGAEEAPSQRFDRELFVKYRAGELLTDIVETSLLFRALVWVHTACPDSRTDEIGRAHV